MYEEIRVKIDKRDGVNRHHVPKKQWSKWSIAGRKVFNEVYSSMVQNAGLFLHPKQGKIPATMWKTTAWNAAWTAASSLRSQS
jgi:hypothetical protein